MSVDRGGSRRGTALRIAPWRGDAATAYLTPARGRPTRASVERSIAELRRSGYRSVLTAALGPVDAMPFLDAGFAVHERLHLLRRSIGRLDDLPAGGSPTRRGRRQDRGRMLEVDQAAFPSFWRLDGPGLDDAIAATPSSRLRVIDRPTGTECVGAYAITGRAAARGYLQRLAVDPALHRQGLGSLLVIDAMVWLRRWGAREVLVNTQEDNTGALALYESLGFQLQPQGLAVLRRAVTEAVH